VEKSYSIEPIGVVRCSRKEVTDDRWGDELTAIELLPPFDERSLLGLDEFSHIEVVYLLDQANWDSERALRRPRGNPAWPEVGIFAQRAKDRPNRIGISICRIRAVEGNRVELGDLDAVEGTPVIDLKPWVTEFGPKTPTFQPRWMSELMEDYWKKDREVNREINSGTRPIEG